MILIADNGAAAGGGIALLLLLAFGLGCYFLPTIVAFSRNKSNKGAIFLLNFLLGWTLIGWVVSIVWAVNNDQQPVIVQQNFGGGSYPATPPPSDPSPR
jgi:hypothetical protein